MKFIHRIIALRWVAKISQWVPNSEDWSWTHNFRHCRHVRL